MAYKASILDGYIIGIGKNNNDTGGITKEQYEEIDSILQNAPSAPTGYKYKLRADNLEWELVELPPQPEPDPDTEEALAILLGGLA